MTVTRFSEAAPVLHERGWRPIPLRPDTKQPAEPGWQQFNLHPWTDRELALAIPYYGTEAVGIALPLTNVAIDVDIVDPDAAAEVARLADLVLGKTLLVRIGMAPKFVRLYRSDGTVTSTRPHPIEIFSGSGQVATFGWHAKAGRPYMWPHVTPLDIDADSPELPLLTATHIRAFLTAVEPVMSRLRANKARTGGGGIGLDAGARLRSLMDRGICFREAARIVLHGALAGGRHPAVLAVVSTGFNRGKSAAYLWRLIEQCAPDELLALVIGDGYLRRVLEDLAPRGDDTHWRITT